MNIYLHVEISARELDSKLLLATLAASKGHEIIVSSLEVIEKGMICITPIDNTVILQKVKHLIRKLKPERIVLEDYSGNYSNKSKRVIDVLKAIQKYSKQKGFLSSSYSREQIRLVFSNWHAKTRYEIAEVISRIGISV